MTFDQCLTYCAKTYASDKKTIFVIGGASIYDSFLSSGLISVQYITQLIDDYKCDVFYKDIISNYTESLVGVVGPATILKRTTININETAHLDLMHKLLNYGIDTLDRTSTGTLSLFGERLEFDLYVFPLMTSRKMFFRGIFTELMLFIRGQTDNQILVDAGVNVWTANTSRKQLDKNNLNHLPIGDMGHSYGFSLRHFGGKYIDCHTNYTGVGFDQLTWLINEIKTNPSSRRLRLSLWEPNHMHLAALPPCLEQYQFYVRDNMLSCMMTQRSSDFAIASGWNVATGALLTYMIAAVCGLQPSRLIWNIGDVHLYKNCIDGIKEQLKRTPNIYPILKFKRIPDDIADFTFDDLQLINYQPLEPISFKMSV
jgi:thymidylate synthase